MVPGFVEHGVRNPTVREGKLPLLTRGLLTHYGYGNLYIVRLS